MNKQYLNKLLVVTVVMILTHLVGFSQAGVDRVPPEINILSPRNYGSHSYFPAVLAKVVDRSYTDIYGGQVQATGVASVKAAIFADGAAWNGSIWFPVTNTEQAYILALKMSGDDWELKNGLPTSFKTDRTKPNTVIKSYSVCLKALDNAGNPRHGCVSFMIEPLEIAFVDANKKFSGVDLSDTRRPLSEGELLTLADLVSWDGSRQSFVSGGIDPQAIAGSFIDITDQVRRRLAALRIGAVADGTTKILVIAKGHDPGLVSFQSSAESKNPEQCKTLAEHAANPVLPVSDSTFELLGNVKELRAAIEAAKKKVLGSRLCTTGPLGTDMLTEVGSNRPAISVNATKAGEGDYFWFALYTVPEGIDPSLENSLFGQQISFKASIASDVASGRSASSSDGFVSSMGFFLKRPPVLLVHGMNDKPNSWKTNSVLEDANFDVRYVDYSSTNVSSFRVNEYAILRESMPIPVPAPIPAISQPATDGNTILTVLNDYRYPMGYAISKVDVVGHSMGGILARLTTQLREYKSDDNFREGYIRRLITIGTPHLGSNISNVLVAKKAEYRCADLALNLGGVDATMDLMIGGDGIRLLQSSSVPSHAIVSIAKTVKGAYYRRFLYAKTCNNIALLSPSIFDTRTTETFKDSLHAGERSDLTVSDISQMGGLRPPYITVFGETDDIDHGEEIGNLKIRLRVLELLKGSRDAFDPSGFPDPISVEPQPQIGDGTSSIITLPKCPSNRPCPVPAPTPTPKLVRAANRGRNTVSATSKETIQDSAQGGQAKRPDPFVPNKNKISTVSESGERKNSMQLEAGSAFSIEPPIGATVQTKNALSVYVGLAPNGDQSNGAIYVEATRQEWESLESAVGRLQEVVLSTKSYLRLVGKSDGKLSGVPSVGLRFTGRNPETGNDEELTCYSILLPDDRRLLYVTTILPLQVSEQTRAVVKRLIESFSIVKSVGGTEHKK